MTHPARIVFLIALSFAGCDACEDESEAGESIRGAAAGAAAECEGPLYGHAHLEALYAVRLDDGDPAILSNDTEAVLAVSDALLAALDRALTVDRDEVSAGVAVVVQGDAWGAASRLHDRRASAPQTEALIRALSTLSAHLASGADERGEDLGPPSMVQSILPSEDGWRELDTEHSSLMHERSFGLRRVFRIFVRGDHDARALVSQLIALDAGGVPYLSDVIGEVELLELDADGPTAARVLHLDRRTLGCGPPALHEESEVHRIPDVGADDFLLGLPAPEPLATLPCQRCHEDKDAFSLPTERTAVRDRLSQVLSQVEERQRAIPLVGDGPPSAL